MEPQTLFELLEQMVCEGENRGIYAYPEHRTDEARRLSYVSLKQAADGKSAELRTLATFKEGAVILMHFVDHLDNILWFWAILYAGCIPALCPPLPNDLDQRTRHLAHLEKLFDKPIILTRLNLAERLRVATPLSIQTVESLQLKVPTSMEAHTPAPEAQGDDLAALMLTSGSTGNAKAVCLTHKQLLASVKGKSTIAHLTRNHSVLNWVGIDHVGALVECHLLALYQRLDQIHVQPTDLITDPLKFLQLISRHHVGRTFSPNFFLASLLKAAQRDLSQLAGVDLQCLKLLVSGGEANPVKTCVEVSKLLVSLGASEPVLSPAFGMTETCAGCIYNVETPVLDTGAESEFASLGRCMPGIEMRVRPRSDSPNAGRGSLQVRGPVVTRGYYKNPSATMEAFTTDGWFDTGDEAKIDETGRLHMTGRIKEHIRINGIAIIPEDVEGGLNGAGITGAVEHYYACFSFRPDGASTERLVVLYLPSYDVDDIQARITTNMAISRNVMHHCGVSPYVLPLDSLVLEKSTLGKLSRGKLKSAFTQGMLSAYQTANDNAMRQNNFTTASTSLSSTERKLLAVFHQFLDEEFGDHKDFFGVETEFLDMGFASVQLILLKSRIEESMGISDLPIVLFLSNTTIRTIAAALDRRLHPSQDTAESEPNSTYSPVVKLRDHGSKAPLWLFHPGVGEVLVFLGLAKAIEDRPIYAFRARGFEHGETFFSSIDEAVDTYYQALKSVQPFGPYALAGYSYGAMLAFETAKRLEANSDSGRQVEFLGSFNLPPHIKQRMSQLGFIECAVHLGYFLDLLTEAQAQEILPHLRGETHKTAVHRILKAAAPARLAELGLSTLAFAHWVELAHRMQAMARDYEPLGMVPSIDVFYCHPLAVVAADKSEWLAHHISKWRDFCSNDVRFHEVSGAHYTMINADHVASFSQTLCSALDARGV